MKKELTRKQQRIIVIVSLAVFAAIIVFLCIFVLGPLVKLASKPEEFRAWVDSKGAAGKLIYIGIVILQIAIAFIPGEPFEIAAGYTFGALPGSLLCLLAESLGSILVLLLVKEFGIRLLEVFFDRNKIESLGFLKSSDKRIVLFLLLFLLPGTPKDLLCYFAGLTDIPLAVLIFICTVCRIPSIITSTVGGDALGTGNYGFAAIMFAITLAISLAGVLIYNRLCKKKSEGETIQSKQ